MEVIGRVQSTLVLCQDLNESEFYWVACRRGMSRALGRKLKKGETIRFNIEVTMAKSSIRLQKVRNPNKLQFSYDLDMADGSGVRGKIEYVKLPTVAADFVEGVFDEKVGEKHEKNASDADVVAAFSSIIDALTTVRDALGSTLQMPA
ncbi:MAG: hypothetical protein ACYSUK_00230 [Planctomycetota bacterium]|jgi:hypothetical protein